MTQNSVADFVGNWQIKWSQGDAGIWSPGWCLLLGTGSAGDSIPWLNGEYQTCLGCAILKPNGESFELVYSTESSTDNQPGDLLFAGGVLRGLIWWEQQPTWIFISLARLELTSNSTYRFLYGTTVWGDPDQVGVWGAEPVPTPPGG